MDCKKDNNPHNIVETTEQNNFFMHQFNNVNLAVFTYYIESEKEAMIIDPLRDIQPYLDILEERKATLKYIFETHFHADFVSGHVDLANRTGATIVFGPTAVTQFQSHVAKDEEIIKLGKIELKVLHTPGHTLESVCFVLISEEKPFCVFTGDTVFLGDVGRPDLAAKSELKVHDLASMLYKSIETKIKTLPDNTWIYPAHGAGSACGKNIGSGFKCKVGTQKINNYALQSKSEQEFIDKVTYNIPVPPQYFFFDSLLNREANIATFESVLKNSNHPLKLPEFEKSLEDKETLIIDTRDITNIANAHVPFSLGISLKSTFNNWVGKLVKPKTNILMVCESGSEREAITQLSRIGYDSVSGYLDGGFDTWKSSNKPTSGVKLITPEEMLKIVEDKSHTLVDIREPGEWEAGVVGEPIKVSLSTLESKMDQLPKDKDLY